jgi:AraC-like DNA-binding protein
MTPGSNEKIYPVTKIATIVERLVAEGVPMTEALAGVSLSPAQLISPTVRVSANQVLQSYDNAAKLSRDPQFAHNVGLTFHVSTYGMYGFALLSCPNFRATMAFAMKYHGLAAPLAEIVFAEESGAGSWTIVPKPYPRIEGRLYRFIVELQVAVHLSLHRDVMGASFCPSEIHFTFAQPRLENQGTPAFDCPVRYEQPENRLIFEARWLDGRPNLGNAVTYAQLCQLCDQLANELELVTGSAGQVRSIILTDLERHANFDSIAERLKMSPRSLRRRLQEEGTSFRELVDEVRAQVAIKYIRDTNLSIEDVTYALGFNDASAFRHAFRRWTGAAPYEFRQAKTNMGSSPV